MRNRLVSTSIVLSGLLLVFFANCSGEFKSPLNEITPNTSNVSNGDTEGGEDNSSSSQGNTGGNDPPAQEFPIVPVIQRSHIFMGTGTNFDYGFIDHNTDTFVVGDRRSGEGSGVPFWFGQDQENGRFFSVDSGGEIHIFDVQEEGQLEWDQSFFAGISGIHLDMYTASSDSYLATVSSYSGGSVAAFELNTATGSMESLGSLDYNVSGTSAFTHSAVYCATHDLFFIANLGHNEISVVQSEGGVLTEVGTHSVINPRTLYYSHTFNLLYLVTETRDGSNSWLYIYRVERVINGGYDSLSQVGQFELNGEHGADFEIDYVNRFVYASVRELGSSGVHVIPINAEGLIESGTARAPQFIETMDRPRSVAVSGDGKYVFATFNPADAEDLSVFKITYDDNRVISNIETIGHFDYEGNRHPSSFVVDEF